MKYQAYHLRLKMMRLYEDMVNFYDFFKILRKNFHFIQDCCSILTCHCITK